MTIPLSQHELRTLLREVLYDDSLLDAFAHDHYPEVHDRFTNGILRDTKHTCLLSAIGSAPARVHEFVNRLEKCDATRVQEALTRITAERRKHRHADEQIDGDGVRRPHLAAAGLLVGGSVALGLSFFYEFSDAPTPAAILASWRHEPEKLPLKFPRTIIVPDLLPIRPLGDLKQRQDPRKPPPSPVPVPIEVEFKMSELDSQFSLLSAGNAGKARTGIESHALPAAPSGGFSMFTGRILPGRYTLLCVSRAAGVAHTKSISIPSSMEVHRYVCP